MRKASFGVRIGLVLPSLALFAAVVARSSPAQATISPSSASAIAGAITVDPTVVTGASFVSKPPSGTPDAVSTTPLESFPTDGSSYGILTTGDATLASQPQSNFASVNDGGGNVRGNTDYDVSILKIDLSVPGGDNCLTFDFQFLSEEWPTFVGSAFNDAFIAELDSSTWTTSGSNISAPNNFAFDPDGNVISINATGPATMNGTASRASAPRRPRTRPRSPEADPTATRSPSTIRAAPRSAWTPSPTRFPPDSHTRRGRPPERPPPTPRSAARASPGPGPSPCPRGGVSACTSA